MTAVKTLKTNTRYHVEGIEDGALVVRQPSGKRRKLTKADVGAARYYAAIQHFRASESRQEAAAA